ncbi:hypothetical protein ONZ45_g1137 [Pleurotus djamor]|nr:hypothetical protein ONZ45_g1137 [Pleurotus djamor]
MPTPDLSEPQLFFGPILIGVFLNTLLYGVLVAQAYSYFDTYKCTDRPLLRYLIVYLLIVETANTGCMVEMIYDQFILKMLSPSWKGPLRPPILLSADALLTVLVSTPVQLFMAYRVRVLAKSLVALIVIACFSIASLAGGISTTVFVIILPDFSKFDAYYPSLITMLASAAAADLIIAIMLAFTLYKKKQQGLGEMNGVINKIVLFAVETGIVTAAFALANLVLILTTTTGFNFIPDLALSKLYTNTILASLNARAGLVDTLKGVGVSKSRSKPLETQPYSSPMSSARPSFDPTIVGNAIGEPKLDNYKPQRPTSHHTPMPSRLGHEQDSERNLTTLPPRRNDAYGYF